MEKRTVLKIAVLGAESTGKTSLCEALAKHYKTVWVPEYARDYFNGSDIYNYTLNDLLIIARKQQELEQSLIESANRFLFCDTTLITLKIWAQLEFEKVPEFISKGIDCSEYDYYLVIGNQMPWVKDDLRQNKFSRDHILSLNLAELDAIQAPYTLIKSGQQEMIADAVEILSHLFPN